jgi:hypothetical protein
MANKKQKRYLSNFDADGALRIALAYDTAASHLRTTGAPVPLGTTPPADRAARALGQWAGMVVLEALAIELVLKVRVSRAGQPVEKTHSHSNLLVVLPAAERTELERRYQESNPPQSSVAIVNKTPTMLYQLSAPPDTLEKLLEASGSLFVKWRYMFQETVVEAPAEQMFHAFAALRSDL